MNKELIISIITIIIISYIGNINTSKNVNTKWYECIKSEYTPPKFVFPIVWTILYLFLIICFQKVLLSNKKDLILLFILNLILNVTWTYLYFNKKNIKDSFINIILLIGTSLIIYYKEKEMRNLYIYYILWLVCAGFLNYDSIGKLCN